ncbi:MAG: hypothetical protein ACTHOU_01390 [Aureliella sp.]
MFQASINQSVYNNSLSISSAEAPQGDVEAAINQTVAALAADVEVLVAVDVSALKAIAILASEDCTLKTNNSGTPDDTLNLVADVPYIWTPNSYHACLLTADVSKIFITNSAASEMTFQFLALTDTP